MEETEKILDFKKNQSKKKPPSQSRLNRWTSNLGHEIKIAPHK